MFQWVSIQFLITNGDIENPIEDLPFTTDGAGRGPFVKTSFHIFQAIFRSDRCERLMPEAMTTGEVVSDTGMAGQNVILKNSFWSRAIDALFDLESLPIQREDIAEGDERTRLLVFFVLNLVNQVNGTLLCLLGR
ncbi:MAG TPA: hypothetical protein PK614_00100 [Nitrospira sp.]|nr:hypothetical protein [Nitrospira sp.]